MGTFSILGLRLLVIELATSASTGGRGAVAAPTKTWGAGECAGESCGPARLPQSRGAAVCAVDEAALPEAAGGPAGCRIAAQPSALLGPMSTTVFGGPAAAPNSRSRGWQTYSATTSLGRRLFPSSLRGASRSLVTGWGLGGLLRGGRRRRRVRRKPELLCGGAARDAKVCEQHLCQSLREL